VISILTFNVVLVFDDFRSVAVISILIHCNFGV
jgi:hypothetical protein